MSKTVAVAMIVKNEEALLARCLDSVIGCDNLYILDTGSTDNTIEIARRYTKNVFLDYIWNDDFSGAHNHLKEKIKEDFILSIDADEMLLVPFEEVRKAVELAKDYVRVQMVAEGAEENKNDFGFCRLFRNSPDIFWIQPIHKHLNLPGEGERVGNVSIMYGHSPAHQLDPDRALRVLEQTVASEENPVRNLYYLGREYWYKARFRECVDTFNRYVRVSQWPAEAADAYLIMAKAYLELNLVQESAMNCLQAIKINPNFKEAVEFMESISTEENKSQWRRMAKTANNQGIIWERVPTEPAPDVVVLAPHNDDEALFCAFLLMRVRPLVIIVTDSYIQPHRGDLGCTSEIRRQETINAMNLIGVPVVFLGIKDTELTEDLLRERLKGFRPEQVYAPAIQGGNFHHDIVGKVALELYGERCEHYCTYTKTELHTTGIVEIKPTEQEINLKNKMLECYQSQLNLNSTRPHFDAVFGKSEWLAEKPDSIKKIMITPYFGTAPEWMSKFKPPNGYDWLFDADLEKFKKRVKDKLGIDYPGVPGSGKVWDFRSALGLLYAEEIEEYDFWGHMDFDVVFGDVDAFLPNSVLPKLDVYSSHNEYVCGCFSLYRNTEAVNNLFKTVPVWKERMMDAEPNGWVEKEFSRALETSGLRYAYEFNQGNPWTENPVLRKDGDKLYQDIEGKWVEIMFFHFRHSKRWPL